MTRRTRKLAVAAIVSVLLSLTGWWRVSAMENYVTGKVVSVVNASQSPDNPVRNELDVANAYIMLYETDEFVQSVCPDRPRLNQQVKETNVVSLRNGCLSQRVVPKLAHQAVLLHVDFTDRNTSTVESGMFVASEPVPTDGVWRKFRLIPTRVVSHLRVAGGRDDLVTIVKSSNGVISRTEADGRFRIGPIPEGVWQFSIFHPEVGKMGGAPLILNPFAVPQDPTLIRVDTRGAYDAMIGQVDVGTLYISQPASK